MKELTEHFLKTASLSDVKRRLAEIWEDIENAFIQKYQLHKFGITNAYRLVNVYKEQSFWHASKPSQRVIICKSWSHVFLSLNMSGDLVLWAKIIGRRYVKVNMSLDDQHETVMSYAY